MSRVPIRLLLLNYEFPPLGGGAGMVTKRLLEEFALQNIHVTLVTTWFEGLEEEEHREKFSIYRLKSRRKKTYQSNPLEMLSWMRKVFLFFWKRTNEYDVCLANFMLPGGGIAYYLKKRWGLPYIVLSHGHDIPWAFPRQMWWWHLLLYPLLLIIARNSSHNIVLTKELKNVADQFTGKEFASSNLIIPNGMEQTPLPKKDFSGKLKIVFGGRLVPQKDPYTFLEAVQQVQENLEVEWIIVGDGQLRKGMEAMVKKNSLRNVRFAGKISHEDVLHIFSEAHVFIAASAYEGMSLSTLEALSAGAYILSTPVTGTEGFVLDDISGNIFPFGDAGALANAIQRYYSEKFLKHYELPEGRFSQYTESHSWKSIAERYKILFQNSRLSEQ